MSREFECGRPRAFEIQTGLVLDLLHMIDARQLVDVDTSVADHDANRIGADSVPVLPFSFLRM